MNEVNKLIDKLERYLDAETKRLGMLDTRMKKGNDLMEAYNKGKKAGGYEVIRGETNIIRDFKETNASDSKEAADKDYILHLNLGTKVTSLSIADALVDWIFYYFKNTDFVEGQASEFLRVVGEALLSEYKRIEKIRELNK